MQVNELREGPRERNNSSCWANSKTMGIEKYATPQDPQGRHKGTKGETHNSHDHFMKICTEGFSCFVDSTNNKTYMQENYQHLLIASETSFSNQYITDS